MKSASPAGSPFAAARAARASSSRSASPPGSPKAASPSAGSPSSPLSRKTTLKTTARGGGQDAIATAVRVPTAADYANLGARFIRNKLAQLGLSTEGMKAQLIERLLAAEQEQARAAADPAAAKAAEEARKETAEVAAAAARAARDRLEKKRDYNERVAGADPLMQRVREEVKAMPTKVVRAQLLNRGFDAQGKRKEVMGRLARLLCQEREEYEKCKSADEKRADELRAMRERIKLQQQVALRRKRAMAKVSVMAKMRIGFAAAATRVRAAATAASATVAADDDDRDARGNSGDAAGAGAGERAAGRKGQGGGAPAAAEKPGARRKFVLGSGSVPAWFAQARRRVAIETLAEGDGTCRPVKGDTVLFHYRTVIACDGTEIDNSFARHIPESFVVGNGDVLRCWEYAVTQMTVGERVRVSSPAEFAFGSSGCLPVVGADTALEFEILLLRFHHPTEADRLKARAEAQAAQGSSSSSNKGQLPALSHLGDELYAEPTQDGGGGMG